MTELGPEEAAPCLQPDVAISSLISSLARKATQPKASSCTSWTQAAKGQGTRVPPAQTSMAAGCFQHYQFSAKLVRKNRKALLSKRCPQPICHYGHECLETLFLSLKLITKGEDTIVSASAERGMSCFHELALKRSWANLRLGRWTGHTAHLPKAGA